MDEQSQASLRRFVQYFETLDPSSLVLLADIYAPQARFIDPFNDVTGLPAIEGIFDAMFEHLESPRFKVLQRFAAGDEAFLSWDFEFTPRRSTSARAWQVHGSTYLRFDAAGRVLEHRDYWDPASQLYERLPVLGILLRYLRKRLKHG